MTTRQRIARAALTLAGVAALIALYLWFVKTWGWMPRCPIKWATGLSCPGCGSQRALMTLLDGNFADAAKANLLLIPATLYLALLGTGYLFPCNKTIGKLYKAATSPATLIALTAIILGWMLLRNLAGC